MTFSGRILAMNGEHHQASTLFIIHQKAGIFTTFNGNVLTCHPPHRFRNIAVLYSFARHYLISLHLYHLNVALSLKPLRYNRSAPPSQFQSTVGDRGITYVPQKTGEEGEESISFALTSSSGWNTHCKKLEGIDKIILNQSCPITSCKNNKDINTSNILISSPTEKISNLASSDI
jgi:hypothetical protein